MNDYDYATMKP